MSSMLDVLPVEHDQHRERATERPSASIAEQLAPALARLELGGDLTYADRDLLDRLSPHNCLSFLVSDGIWIHPDNVPLFDYSVIDSLVAQCGSAVMTHHYRPRPGVTESYAVQTAVVNPGWEQPLVVGVFGPYLMAGENPRQGLFEQLVSDIRTGYQIASTAVRRIRSELARPEPVLVVTPGDSCIVAANPAAARSLEVTPTELVGMPYQDIVHLLSGVTTVTRIESGPVDFSLIAVAPSVEAPLPTEDQSKESGSATDLSAAIEHMFSALEELDSLSRLSHDGVSAGVMSTIHNQAQVLRSRLTHLTGVSEDV